MTDTRHPHEECCHDAPAAERVVVQPGKAALLKRLARIEGQVRGIGGMIEADRYCVDVLTQVAAVKSAMDAVALQLLENHMKGCVARALQQGDATGMVTELIDVVKKVR
ncbi:metal-sensitive transcriptional regulator [Chromobacterium subtsugae]|uniref:Metal-sensitive transcriptional regulator n=1 Tax=Chromobacterium subtsugae TaxID=251747 RepID=A0ABS7FDW4_9NEIS|nr:MULTISPECIES: metal-sensitive transcriptional regulator [Chromobacterium]KUM04023.1 transcriptional regulator [Chromobacterium subtsugae]KZE86887.1 transcriptional regulator [Chromobacterium sp. F49]MBW7566856.1 metal-sensitive transcriptional regulator [Chromobacterium subtsugae]MBW8288161.1 metal-sensitive transcriptional regulator [Chromobacterium subtsugae]OBU86574.1 transcriptional regulator [Chromobacterium subtsugae]